MESLTAKMSKLEYEVNRSLSFKDEGNQVIREKLMESQARILDLEHGIAAANNAATDAMRNKHKITGERERYACLSSVQFSSVQLDLVQYNSVEMS